MRETETQRETARGQAEAPDDANDVTATASAGPDPASWAGRVAGWVAAHPRVPLAVALALALVARLLLIARSHAMIDGDEALVGIQAERILRGEYPTYFYAQPYMGSLEAYLAAGLFRVFGPSAWALRAVPLLLSLPLVYLTWRLARALLPKEGAQARVAPLLAGLAALVAAVPPLYDAVAELRAWGGQIEVYVVSVALLLVTVELADRLQAARGGARVSAGELAGRWALWGLLVGLGVWINPLISYALVASCLWLALPLLRRLPRASRRYSAAREHAPSVATGRAPLATVAPLVAIVPGLALGGLPAWLYAARHSADNLLIYVSQPAIDPNASWAARHGPLTLRAVITARYFSCVAPRVLDGGLPSESPLWLPLRYLLLLPALGAIVCALWLLRHRATAPLRVGPPLLYAGVVSAVFCLGSSAWAATLGRTCTQDWAGRYAVPLALALPLLLPALVVLPQVWRSLQSLLRRRPGAGARGPWRAASSIGARRAASARRTAWGLAMLLILLGAGAQLATYGAANPATLFQSPYYQRIALDQSELTGYLKAHDISAAWANHWLGNIVTFETDGATVCADYYDQARNHGVQRPPGALATVSAANAPSFLLNVQDPHPELARELDAQGIPYTLAVLPRSGVTVITPARTVDPATLSDAALNEDFQSQG